MAAAQRRNANATLSPAEFAALRRVAIGAATAVSAEHRAVLLGMGLIQSAGLDGLVLTELGRRRLQRDTLTAWRGAPARNPFDRPAGK